MINVSSSNIPQTLWLGLESRVDQSISCLTSLIKLYKQNNIIASGLLPLKFSHSVSLTADQETNLPALNLNIYSADLPANFQLPSQSLVIKQISLDCSTVNFWQPDKSNLGLIVNFIKDQNELIRSEVNLGINPHRTYAETSGYWQKLKSPTIAQLAYLSIELISNTN